RAVGIEGVDRVQAPTQADLQYDGVERLRRKNLPRSQGTELEIRERDLTASALDRFERRAQACVAQGHAVEANALVVTKEVRRRIQTHSVSGGEQNRFQHRAGRALAVGAGDAVYRHPRYPPGGRIAPSIARVEPLPLVPATVKSPAELALPRRSRPFPPLSNPSWMYFGWMRSM